MNSSNRLVSITDHIQNPDIESKILGNLFTEIDNKKVTDLLVWHQKIDKEYISRFEKVFSVVRYGVGYDNIDLDYCRKSNIIVCNTPDYGVDEVSDTALAMILNLTRGINTLRNLAKSSLTSWMGNPPPPSELRRLQDLNIGIIGFGRIGSALLNKCKPLCKNLSFYDPYIPTGIEKSFRCYRHQSISDLLQWSDIVSINCNLTNETALIIDKDFLKSMKKGSILVNVSRGGIYNSMADIEESLMSNHLHGFATDVWPKEPPSDNDEVFKRLTADPELTNRVIITPHTSYYSRDSIVECRNKATFNILDIINGKNPKNIIS